MEVIDVNQATPQQLSILLSLRPNEVERLLAARPFTDLLTLRRTLPFRVARDVRSFAIPKLDLNAVSQDDLVNKLAISFEVAKAIVKRRPYYFLSELSRVPEVTPQIFALLSSVGAVPKISYVDKSTGRSISLEPDPSKVMVNFGDTEGEVMSQVAKSLGLTRAFPRIPKRGPQIFSMAEAEGAEDVFNKLRQKPGVESVVPGFREGNEQRFLDPERCIVQFRPEISVDRQSEIIAKAGLEVVERHRSPGLVTLGIPAAREQPGVLMAALTFLNNQPEVKFAEPNFLGFDDMEGPDNAASGVGAAALHWHLNLIRLPAAWNFGKGMSDVILAVVDSGVDVTHPALRDAILPRGPTDDWDFVTEGAAADPLDEEGHGTFITGILVGNGSDNIQGICPGCRILPLKVPLSGEPNGYARRADAILYALDYAGSRRLIINTSWKTTGDVAVVRQAIEAAQQRGAVVVASAGNDPDRANQPHFPSDYPQAISVAAVRPDGGRATYSFYGDRINVAAPGGAGGDNNDPTQDLLSAAPAGGVLVAAGTSFAAPHVAGVSGLLLSQDPTMTPAEILSVLQSTARPLPDYGLGHGLIDAGAAVTAVAARKQSGTTTTTGPGTSNGLAAINRSDVDELVTQFGLRRFTAMLLIARRPLVDIQSVRGTLGLTSTQYASLAGAG